jgi:acyl-CoA synthetase (AMP-forming)/AMP-acid ligase II
MFAWNFGDILDGVSAVIPPDAPALIHGDRVIRWGQATARSNNLAKALVKRGAVPGDKVAFYMHNRPEYTETLAACFKARLVHVNVNYRYTPEEVLYIFDNSDAQTVVYGQEFRANIESATVVTSPSASRRCAPRAMARRSRSRAAPTTCSSSTPAAPPACPRA